MAMKSLSIAHLNRSQSTISKWRSGDPSISEALEGDPVVSPPRFRLEMGSDFLQFTVGCDRPAWNDLAKAKPKTFLANLWKQDVGELFIKAAASDRYLEINLSPYGAWWACVFSDHRKSDNSIALPKVQSPLSSVQAEAWQSSLVLPLDYLETTLGFGEGSKANVCFILGPADARRHFSWAPLPVGPPNFHRAADFVPVNIAD